jgi:hypothetical protein
LLKIGQTYPEIQDRLLNYYQLAHTEDEIAQYAAEHFIEKNPFEQFQDCFQPRDKSKILRMCIMVFIIALISAIVLPTASSRMFHSAIAYEPQSPYKIWIETTNETLYAYDSLTFSIHKQANERFAVELYFTEDNSRDAKFLLRSYDTLLSYSQARVRHSGTYIAKLHRPNIFYPRKYMDTDTLALTVLQRPRILSMDFIVVSPPYTQIPNAYYQGNMDKITCLQGSSIILDIMLSEPAGASYLLSGDDSLRFDIKGAHCYIKWQPMRSGEISFLLQNADGIASDKPSSYRIELIPDAFPRLELITPKIEEDILLNEDMQLPYIAHLQDDFGLSSFSVNYSIHSEYSFAQDTNIYSLDLKFDQNARYQTRAGVWEIDRFISPGSEIVYYFELSDNDTINGPKHVRSNKFQAKLPTLADLYSRQNQAQDKLLSNMEEILADTDLAKEIEDIRKDLLQEGEMKWENKATLEENLNAMENVQKELSSMQEAMKEQKKFMEENALFSEKTLENYEQLQELMNELIDDELFEMMKEIQEKLQQNNTDNMEKILEDFSEKAKKFEESLERMLEIFKRIQQEQRLEELGEQIKELLQEQEKILDDKDKRSSNELAERENALAKDTEKWEELSKKSAELFSDEERENYDAFLEKMEEMQTSSTMQDASSKYQQGQKQQGDQQSQQAAQQLGSLQQDFQEMSESMMQKQKDQIENAFRKAFFQTLYMSFEQEKLKEYAKSIQSNSPLIHHFTSQENRILQQAKEISDGLLALSKMTFLVDKVIGQQLGLIIANIQTGIQQIEEAKLATGKKNIDTAFESMNELGRILLERMNMVQDQQEGNASGMEFYMQQLQQMAGQQQQINSGMPQMGMSGSPNSMMDELAKMAARQQALRRSLKQMQQGMSPGDTGKRLMGDLDRIAKDMEDVINQMRKNQVNRETLLRQEKIVQRLLDASRSATSQDYKKERESQTGKDLLRENPLHLPGDMGEHESLINAIRREVQESDLSPSEKREMERYLESLLHQHIRQGDTNK